MRFETNNRFDKFREPTIEQSEGASTYSSEGISEPAPVPDSLMGRLIRDAFSTYTKDIDSKIPQRIVISESGLRLTPELEIYGNLKFVRITTPYEIKTYYPE